MEVRASGLIRRLLRLSLFLPIIKLKYPLLHLSGLSTSTNGLQCILSYHMHSSLGLRSPSGGVSGRQDGGEDQIRPLLFG